MADQLQEIWEELKQALLFECLPAYLITCGVSAELPLWPSCCGERDWQVADVLEYHRLVRVEADAIDWLLATKRFEQAKFLMEISADRLLILAKTLEHKINTI